MGSLVQWLYRQWYRQESITAAGTRVEPPTRYHVRKWSAFKIGHFGKYYLFSDAGKQNVCSLFFFLFFFFFFVLAVSIYYIMEWSIFAEHFGNKKDAVVGREAHEIGLK